MMNGGSIRRILGFSWSSVLASSSHIWILGVCYQVAQESEDSSNQTQSEGFAAFIEDFSSRILITYRKGFSPIQNTKYTCDANWGCMLRSSQMLVAQAFLVHRLGRSWRKSSHKSLGILGGRPGASTYIIGVQDENPFYLDPHEVHQVVDIKSDNLDTDTSSYHCNVVRHIPLDSIGFYCRDKSDFDDFCVRSSELIDQSNGAPLFTIAQTRSSPNSTSNIAAFRDDNASKTNDHRLVTRESEDYSQEDDWQLL